MRGWRVVLGALLLTLVGSGPVWAQAVTTVQYSSPTKATVAWTSATTINTASTVTISNLSTVIVTLSATSTMTGGVLSFEVDDGSGTWWAMQGTRTAGASLTGALDSTFTLAVTNQAWEFDVGGFTSFRVRLSTVITGSGTATVAILPSAQPSEPSVTAVQPNAASLNATVTLAAGSALAGEIAEVGTATTTDALSTCYLTSAATTNATNCKASAGNVYAIHVTNTTTTNYFLRLYNLAAAPTCSSSTGFVETIPALGASANGGVNGRINGAPQAYATGIGFCLTGGGTSTDNTSAATGVYITIEYKN